jgi:hypothetical protein
LDAREKRQRKKRVAKQTSDFSKRKAPDPSLPEVADARERVAGLKSQT